MSINALGVSAYTRIEHADQRNRSEVARSAAESAKQAGISGKSSAAEKITIPQKTGATSSALAVSNDLALSDILSVEEKQAIDELFAKYDFPQAERTGYNPLGEKTAAVGLGQKVDFKV